MAAKSVPASVPIKPTAMFCGKVMSREFTDRAYALRDVLAAIDDGDDEQTSAARVSHCV